MYYFFRDLFKKIFVGSPKVEVIKEPILKSIDPPVVGSGSSSPKPKEYELIATTKAEPCMVPKTPDYPMRPYTGSTTYLFQEKSTGEFNQITVPGLEETPLSVILEKVDTQGPTRLEKDGKVYLVGKVEEEEKITIR